MDEPRNFGAVVSDRQGQFWIRVTTLSGTGQNVDGAGTGPWKRDTVVQRRMWDEIEDPVEVWGGIPLPNVAPNGRRL